MVDYIVYYKTKNTQSDTLITLENDCPTSDFLEEIILEELRDQLEIYDVEIIEIKPLIDGEVNVEDLLVDDYEDEEY